MSRPRSDNGILGPLLLAALVFILITQGLSHALYLIAMLGVAFVVLPAAWAFIVSRMLGDKPLRWAYMVIITAVVIIVLFLIFEK